MKFSSFTKLLVCLCIFSTQILHAQDCGPEESTISLSINTDSWGYETSWQIIGGDGTVYGQIEAGDYGNNTLYTETICIPADECISFNLWDTYGDGIIGEGYVNFSLNGGTIFNQNLTFSHEWVYPINCSDGQFCNGAILIDEGEYVAEEHDRWYVFIPDSVGIYSISTCLESNDCDTKIWIYEGCSDLNLSDDNEGTLFYSDNEDGCGSLAVIEGLLEPGNVYYIRIGDADNDCSDSPIALEINYFGPIVGCMDQTACNYNPLASESDGSCIYFGNPNCPAGPDLLINQSTLENSLYVSYEENTDPCNVAEGCMNGYGIRELIRFTTRIENIGETDYLIGSPSLESSQFTYDNCHNHFHYDGYAEYVVFNNNDEKLPIGFKNGFCVLDLSCNGGGNAQYGCGYMGISAGCEDTYDSSLDCQFIDVTDIPDGNYTFVTRVNWDLAPDLLGRIEMDTFNNWAQVCLELDRSSGTLEFTVKEDCDIYTDCAGIEYGDTQPDCEGICGGPTLMGDVNNTLTQDMDDAYDYLTMMIGEDIEASNCYDLSNDNAITIYDAALMSSCALFGTLHDHTDTGPHDHCNFNGILNTNNTVLLSIQDWNPSEQYVDIGMRNAYNKVLAYQFQMSGLAIESVENMVDPAVYPITPVTGIGDGMIYGISYQDSTIFKSQEPQPLVRIFYNEIIGDEICIDMIHDIVNQDYENTLHLVEGGCLTLPLSGTNQLLNTMDVKVSPNPFDVQTTLRFTNLYNETFRFQLMDATGKIILTDNDVKNNEYTIFAKDLPSGIYFYKLTGEQSEASGKVTVRKAQ